MSINGWAKMKKEQISKYAFITMKLSEEKKEQILPKYAPILKLPVGYDYRKLPLIPDSWCDRKAWAVKSLHEGKEQWKHFVANYID